MVTCQIKTRNMLGVAVLQLLALLFALLLVCQVPLDYHIDVGIHEGYGGDLPMLAGFNTPEQSEHGSYRWSDNNARISLPGVGKRPLFIQLDILPISPDIATIAPNEVEVWVSSYKLATLPVRQEGMQAQLFIPDTIIAQGTLHLVLRSDTFTPPDDPRNLGVPLDSIRVTSPQFGVQGWTTRLVIPDWYAVGVWLIAAALMWGIVAINTQYAPWITTIAMLFIAIAAWLDPPRWAYGTYPVLVVTILCAVLSLILRALLPWLSKQFAIPMNRRTMGWLVLIIVVAFGLRYGGRLYPQSMEGDINFHTHRFDTAIRHGDLFLTATNRGVDFPYPPGGYITAAPLALITPHAPTLLQYSSGLIESLSAVLVYTIVVTTLSARSQKKALLAAALYVFTAAGFMTNWWSFDTHIYTQAAALVLITTLVFLAVHRHVLWGVARYAPKPRSPSPLGRGGQGGEGFTLGKIPVISLIPLLLAGVFVGHFGFFINTVAYGALLIAIVWIAAWRGDRWSHMSRVPMTVVYVGAGIAVALFFYQAYIPMFLEHARITADGGLSELAQREPVTRAKLWQGVWTIGIIQHTGFFPLMLMPVGLALVMVQYGKTLHASSLPKDANPPSTKQRGIIILAIFIICSICVSLLFALIPFFTLSSQSTRWMMFSMWAIAIGASVAAHYLWNAGKAGRLVCLTMVAFVLWNTATYWLGPLAWRIRPPEPF